MRSFPVRGFALTLVVFPLVQVLAPAEATAQELVDLKVDSTSRKYDPKNPVQAAKQEFSLSKPGMLVLKTVIDPYQKDAKGGFSLEEVEARNYTIGTGVFQKRTPDTGVPGQRYTFEQHWLCAARDKPLNLRASLVAPHRWQAVQIPQSGDQLAANQGATITFIPFDKLSAEPGPEPSVDVAGKWYHGDENAVLTFTPTSKKGEYEVTEKGYDNIKGTAKVKGNRIYIDWLTTTAKDGKQKRGVTMVEIHADGTHAQGWSVGEAGLGGERWSAVPGTSAKPLPKTGAVPVVGKWEYRLVDVPFDEALGAKLEKRLADLGAEGWELSGVIVPPTATGTVRFILKRPGK